MILPTAASMKYERYFFKNNVNLYQKTTYLDQGQLREAIVHSLMQHQRTLHTKFVNSCNEFFSILLLCQMVLKMQMECYNYEMVTYVTVDIKHHYLKTVSKSQHADMPKIRRQEVCKTVFISLELFSTTLRLNILHY